MIEKTLYEILKNGIYVKPYCIGVNLIINQLGKDLKNNGYFAEKKSPNIRVYCSEESEPICIITLNEDGISFYWNPSATDYKAEKLIEVCIKSFYTSFGDASEAILELEDDGIDIMPIQTEDFQ